MGSPTSGGGSTSAFGWFSDRCFCFKGVSPERKLEKNYCGGFQTVPESSLGKIDDVWEVVVDVVDKVGKVTRFTFELKRKKVFTRTNKFIVRMKGLGIIAICFYAPLFLSMPIGSIISAKFFGKDNRTFPLIVLGIGINGLITTGIAYSLAAFFE